MKKRVGLLLVILIIFTSTFVISESIADSLHLNIQTINSTDDVVAGTFKFEFNITSDSTCANILYSNHSTLTTDARGIISYYLENVNLNFSDQYWLCYYRDGVLINNSKIVRSPVSFIAKNVSAQGIINDSNLNLVGKNISASTGFFSFLGDLLTRVTSLFVQDIDFTGKINGSGNINTTGNVTASYFIGDGSLLTGISGENATWNESLARSFFAPNTTAGIQMLINETGIWAVYNSTYESYASNVSRNWTLDTFNNWNSTWDNNWLIAMLSANDTSFNTTANIQTLINGTNMNFGNVDFNDGWTSGGASIIDGNLFAQTVYVYNISSLSVNNLFINGSNFPSFDNQFDLGNSTLRWQDLFLSGQVYSNGTGNNYFLGSVGIGSSLPKDDLFIQGGTVAAGNISLGNLATPNYESIYMNGMTGVANYNLLSSYTDQNLYINRPSSKNIVFRGANADQMVLNSSGNLGIGLGISVQPVYLLQVANSANALNVSGNLYVNSSNVGIGTANPFSKLHIYDTTAAAGLNEVLWLTGGASTSQSGPSMVFNTYWGGAFPTWQLAEIGAVYSGEGGWHGALIFSTNTGAAVASITEKMRISALGYVGIGTSVPSQTLDVRGQGNFSGVIFVNNVTEINGSTYNASYASFNSTTNIQQLYNATASAIANLSISQQPSSVNYWGSNGSNIYNDTAKRVLIGSILDNGDESITNLTGDKLHIYNEINSLSDNEIILSTTSLLHNKNTNNVSTATHGASIMGWAYDDYSGSLNVLDNTGTLFGVEGRTDGQNIGTSYVGVLGLSVFNGSDTDRVGVTAGVESFVQVLMRDKITPLENGTAVGFWATPITGGSTKYSLLGYDPLLLFNSSTFTGNLTVFKGGYFGENVGLGIASPSYKLEITNSANALNVSGFLYANSSNVGIGTNNPINTLDIIGKINFTGTINNASFITNDRNILIGQLAGYGNIGTNSVALGYNASGFNTQNYVTTIGYESGKGNIGLWLTALGYGAGDTNSGEYVTVVGPDAGFLNTGDDVIGIGVDGATTNSGNKVIAIGRGAGNTNLGNDSVFIGYEAGLENTVSNQFIIQQRNINAIPLIQGNFSSGFVGIGTTLPNALLEIKKGGAGIWDLNVSGLLYVNSSNVGVGSTNPSSKLSINGDGNPVTALYADNGDSAWAFWADGQIYYSDNNFIGEGSPSATFNPLAKLQINDSSMGFPRIVLSGQEFYQSNQVGVGGVAFLLGVNRYQNKQLWIGDSEYLTQNNTNTALRLGVGGSGLAIIEALSTNGGVYKNLAINPNGGGINFGGGNNIAYNGFGTTLTPDSGQITDGNDVYIADDLEVDGTMYLTGGYTQIVSADVAENLQTIAGRNHILCKANSGCMAQTYEKELFDGEVVCIDTRYGQVIMRCNESNSRLVAGVVSNTSVINMGNHPEYSYPIAVAGIVWTKVTTENGLIYPGDFLVSGTKAGTAMKNNEAKTGTILGKAFDYCVNYDENIKIKECTIPMFVALS
ncbi:hypothetical protein M0R19_01390 [Candidatus Pacearchaeota archaeon]|nr:hypothetical protein [Candidatus Pacearchaeota archaeon]